ncbi:MAG: hypothetical protein EAZ85_03440 [Bacteroidetes bacterium]|nr:MAG: hypothetical protein EAZ85_03440 [Bacteroidota bacterium]
MKGSKKNVKYPYKTILKIKKEYPDSWVLLLNAVRNPKKRLSFLGGEFVYADKDREKVVDKCASLKHIHSAAFVYTGKIVKPKNTIICL